MIINQRYSVIKKIGEGRSKVFLAEDGDKGARLCAIKILENINDDLEVKTFKEEYYILTKLNHPNIINCFESGTVLETIEGEDNFEIKTGSLFFTLEYFSGIPLYEFPEINDENILINIIKQIGGALYYLHQSNFIFSDIKSENILVAQTPDGPQVKFIDFGFTHLFSPTDEAEAMGTAEYIAPEILRHEICDHRVDLYALGILLYRTIYNEYPFERNSEMEIYKAHLEKDFIFHATHFSGTLINAVKKLLEKNPQERYLSTLQLLLDLNIPIDEEIRSHWVPARIFLNKINAISAVDLYISDKTGGEVLTLRGGEGSGKSPILDELYRSMKNTLLLKASEVKNELTYWKVILKKLFYSAQIYTELSDDLKTEVKEILSSDNLDVSTILKSVFSKMLANKKLVILIDSFNEYDSFNREILQQLVLVAQINKQKVILTEHIKEPFYSENFQNAVVFDLVPYNKKDIASILDSRFAAFFPKSEIQSLIMKYADLNPIGLMNFFKEIISVGILNFNYEGPYITSDSDLLNYLKTGKEERLKKKVSLLNENEILAGRTLSAFNIDINRQQLGALLNFENKEMQEVIEKLAEKNIIQTSASTDILSFSDSILKKIFWELIENKDEFYHELAVKITSENIPISKAELARIYEAGKDYLKSLELYKEELNTAEKLNALQYQRSIISHLIKFPISKVELSEYKLQLADILLKLSENKRALNLTNVILKDALDEDQKLRALVLKGSALVRVGEPQQGKNVLNYSLSKLKEPAEISRVMLEIADADFDMSNFEDCKNICAKVIAETGSSQESIGKAHNLIGMVYFFSDNDLDSAIVEFDKAIELFKATKLTVRYAGTKVNLGNLYFLKGDKVNAERQWSEALSINRDIGNLDQEAKLLLSYGIYFFENLQFEKAIEYQKRAQNIFSSYGDKNGLGLVLTNLGEIFLETCSYQEAHDSLQEANFLFKQLSNTEEEAQVIFMLGKLFATIGHNTKLLNTIKYYNKLIENNKLSEKHILNLSLLQKIGDFLSEVKIENIDELKNIQKQFWEAEDHSNYIFSGSFFIEKLIENQNYELAKILLDDDQFKEECFNNTIYKANYNFLTGKLASNWDGGSMKPAFEYFQQAYDLIAEEDITENTWKIVFTIAETLVKRGNFSKAEEFIFSAKYLILFIADNIEDKTLKNIYLNEPYRKSALEKLEAWEKEF